jgi:hypothetical protein
MGARRQRAPIRPVMDYSLRPGLSFCRDGDRFIFLDVPRDRYFALTDRAAACFARLTDGAPASDEDEPQLRSLVGQLLVEGAGPPIRAVVPPPRPRTSLIDVQVRADPCRDIMAWVAFRRAILQVRYRSLDHLLARLARTKSALGPEQASARTVAERAASSFHRAGSLASLSDRCLPHSIAASRWLHRRGVNAILVIGVSVDPFQAHSWVQVDDMLVNERVEGVRDFLPILVI